MQCFCGNIFGEKVLVQCFCGNFFGEKSIGAMFLWIFFLVKSAGQKWRCQHAGQQPKIELLS